MEQSLELMRKRHAYFTELDIHTAQEFYERLHATFEMFGVDIYLDDDSCLISITCEDYDFEDYTVNDGVAGGMATVTLKCCCSNVEGDIFEIDNLNEAFIG